MDLAETLSYFAGRQDEIISSIREIVEIESPSFDEQRSKQVVDWVVSRFETLPFDVTFERTPVAGCGEHLVMRMFPSDAPPLLLLGHTDTVHPVGTRELNPTRVDGDRFYGCGIFDMKANIILALEALRHIGESGIVPPHPVNILLSCDEEVGSKSGRELVEREAAGAAACLVLEPSLDGNVKTGRKGTAMYTLRARGIPAHAGLDPEKGASAITEIARQIEIVQRLNGPERGTTVSVCTVRGGTTSNVIPEHAECEVDVRFTTLSEAERIDSEISALTNIDARVKLDVTGGINRPPMERTAAVAGLYEKARSIGRSFGYELGEKQVGGASDGNFVGAMGIPVIDGLGVAGAGAHTLDEHILISDIANRSVVITLMMSSGY